MKLFSDINQIIFILMILISMNFILMTHPLSMGLMLLIQTILISLLCGMMYYTYWFSYILFLVMIGGMLILFIYMTSLASNELFNLNMNTVIFMMIIFSLMLSLSYFYDNFMFLIKNFEVNNINNLINNENSFNLIKLYNNPTMNITMMVINYLLLTLIIVVKITDISYGPLRQKN
uniref:NADH-ubiquinone oxidoreductase chain 6 n=1 Tax=Hemerobius spodipennis TaxID=2775101 RepID=A0A7L7YXW8_9NEOP|nr:NADH dehydrogenase subunit 6 [Hemerobius spodipennis]QOD41875.1 NADH dehydrogenase subunit 6 [Hemerobius spodipennis]